MLYKHLVHCGVCVLLLLVTLSASAQDVTVEVVGKFKDRAVLLVDGKQRVLRSGQYSPEGIKLIEARDDGASLEIDGVRKEVRMGAVIRPLQSSLVSGSVPEMVIYRDRHGMFRTVGSINSMPVSFLVDTGATSIAMNAAQARRLGIDYRVAGDKGWVETASGVASVYRIVLSRVKVGEIELHNVKAVVLEGAQPSRALLGMSFLGRLEIINEGAKMTLRKKY